MCTTAATMAAKLKIVTSKPAREHVSTQGTLARGHISTQSTLTCENISMQSTLAREHISTQGTFLARRKCNLAGFYVHVFFFIWNTYFSICIIKSITTFTTIINSKSIIKRFIRFYINKRWSSLTYSIV